MVIEPVVIEPSCPAVVMKAPFTTPSVTVIPDGSIAGEAFCIFTVPVPLAPPEVLIAPVVTALPLVPIPPDRMNTLPLLPEPLPPVVTVTEAGKVIVPAFAPLVPVPVKATRVMLPPLLLVAVLLELNELTAMPEPDTVPARSM